MRQDDGATVTITLPPDVQIRGRTVTFPPGHPVELGAIGEPVGGYIPLTLTIPVLGVTVGVAALPPPPEEREAAVAKLWGHVDTEDPQPK